MTRTVKAGSQQQTAVSLFLGLVSTVYPTLAAFIVCSPLQFLAVSQSSHSCVCPVIDHKFRHNIVKVAVDPQTTLTML